MLRKHSEDIPHNFEHARDGADIRDNQESDFIPPGTFYADGSDDLRRERVLAIKLVEEKGNELASERPEIVELYEDPSMRLIDIAYRVYPKEEVDKYPEVYSRVVGWAIRKLNSSEKQAALTAEHRRHVIKLNFDFSSQEFIKQCQNAAQLRHQKHGVDTEAMIRGRGRVPWSTTEKAFVKDLLTNSNFQHQSGSIQGTPDHGKIADELNRLFHDNQEVRTRSSVGATVRDFRRQKG